MGQLSEARDLTRPSQQVALNLVAKLAFEKRELGGCLDALRQDRKTQRPAKSQHRAYYGGRLIVDIDRFDEGPVDLHLVEGKGPQVRKRRVARSEIIHRNTDSQHLNPPERRQRAIQIAHERRLGDLQLQPPGGETGLE